MSVKNFPITLIKRILMVGILCLMLLPLLVASVTVANDVHAVPELVEGQERVSRDTSFVTKTQSGLDTLNWNGAGFKAISGRTNVGVVGYHSSTMHSRLSHDASLTDRYSFVNLGDDWSDATIQPYDMIVVSEFDGSITSTESNALRGVYEAGKPIVMGMDDVNELPLSVKNDLYYIFGVTNARDSNFVFGQLSDHPISKGIASITDIVNDQDQDSFDENGAEWVVRGSDGNNYVLAYAGTARTVIMGEQLDTWYGASPDLLRNALDWANTNNPPISVAIDGPEIGGLQKDYTFTATVSSPIAKLPMTYVWQATGQDDVIHNNVAALEDTVTFSWPITGTKTIIVTASNAAGSESNSQTITIVDNLLPEARDVSITPSEPGRDGLPLRFVPTVGTEITVDYEYFDGDDHSEGQTLIRWSRGDQIQQQVQPTLNEKFSISSTMTTILEELWCVTVTPHDGLLYGEPSEACVYIGQIPNLVPIVDEATMTENPSSSDPLEVEVKVTDPDASSAFRLGENKVITETRWYRDGVFQPAFNDNRPVLPRETNIGETWCARIRGSDDKGFGPEKESNCIIISPSENKLPVVEDLKITPEEPKDSDALQISYLFVDPDGESRFGEGETQINWFRNGHIQPHLNNKRVVPAEFTAPGEKWSVTVRPHDGQGYGRLSLSAPEYIGRDESKPNTPPEVTNLLITPADPGDGDVLKLNYDFVDPDGDPQGKTTIQWYKNSSRVPSFTSTVLEPKHTQPGDVWYAVVAPHDGQEYGLDVAAHSVTIREKLVNNPPRALNVFLTPALPGNDQDLQLYYLFDDQDGDLPGKSEIRWTLDSERQADYDDRSAIPASRTDVGQTWCATVRPYDEHQKQGTTVPARNCVKIEKVGQNKRPDVTDAHILPAPATSDDDLELKYEYSDPDNDRERDTIINWYRNGELLDQFNNQTVIPASETSAGQQWTAYIVPHDGTDIGGKFRTPAITINSQPKVVASIVPMVPFESHNLMLSYLFTDANRDPQSQVRIHWYKNDLHQKQYDGQKKLPSEAIAAGESWHAQIAVSDGLQFSEAVTTDVVTIRPNRLLYLPMIIRPQPRPDMPTPTPIPPTPTATPTAMPTPVPFDSFEQNNSQENAYGPLVPAKEYDALPNDQDDWYYFELKETSSDVKLQVNNYEGDGQLVLYREEQTNGEFNRVEIANDGRGEGFMEIPNNLKPNVLKELRPGKYFVRVYTVDDYHEDSSYRYRLRVEYDLR